MKPLGTLTELTSLSITNSPIDNASLLHLSKLVKLRMLTMNGTKVTGEGMAALKKKLLSPFKCDRVRPPRKHPKHGYQISSHLQSSHLQSSHLQPSNLQSSHQQPSNSHLHSQRPRRQGNASLEILHKRRVACLKVRQLSDRIFSRWFQSTEFRSSAARLLIPERSVWLRLAIRVFSRRRPDLCDKKSGPEGPVLDFKNSEVTQYLSVPANDLRRQINACAQTQALFPRMHDKDQRSSSPASPQSLDQQIACTSSRLP